MKRVIKTLLTVILLGYGAILAAGPLETELTNALFFNYSPEAIRAIINKGALVNYLITAGNEKYTPLVAIAAHSNDGRTETEQEEITRLLLQAGANPHTPVITPRPDMAGKTALDYALQNNRTGVIKVLNEYKAEKIK